MGKKSSARNEIPGFPVSPSLPLLPTSLPNSTPALPSILSHLAASRASSSQLEGKEGGREESGLILLPPFGSVFVVTRFKWLLVLSVARTHSLPSPDCQSINKAKSSRSQYIYGAVFARSPGKIHAGGSNSDHKYTEPSQSPN